MEGKAIHDVDSDGDDDGEDDDGDDDDGDDNGDDEGDDYGDCLVHLDHLDLPALLNCRRRR